MFFDFRFKGTFSKHFGGEGGELFPMKKKGAETFLTIKGPAFCEKMESSFVGLKMGDLESFKA